MHIDALNYQLDIDAMRQRQAAEYATRMRQATIDANMRACMLGVAPKAENPPDPVGPGGEFAG